MRESDRRLSLALLWQSVLRPAGVLGCATMFCATANIPGEETNTAVASLNIPPKSQFHLYLLLGQSNMAGRGVVGEQDKTPHPRVLMLHTNGTWQIAVEPVTHDKPALLGVGPGLAFGKVMAERNPGVALGLVPCAYGGSPLERWQKGGDLYAQAVERGRLAAQSGTLRGVLWHQGESDSKPGLAETYGERLAQMIRDLRADLGQPNLPFVAGQLGEFLHTRQTNNVPEALIVNEAIAQLPKQVSHAGFVKSKGLGHKGDQLHFNTAAQHKLGRRFAAELLRVQARSPE